MSDGKLVTKFVGRYGMETHDLLANGGWHPNPSILAFVMDKPMSGMAKVALRVAPGPVACMSVSFG